VTRHDALAAAIPGYAKGKTLSVPGVWDGLSIKLVEQAGFPCALLSGGALSMARHGQRDMGLVTMTEVAQAIGVIREVSGLPLLVDADTGFGHVDNVARTMRVFEAAGATAIQLEDQLFPKRCGVMAGKAVIPPQEHVDKLKAALDSRRHGTLVIARTDAYSIEGFSGALDRAALYVETGADLIFIEGPGTRDEMQAIGARFGADFPLVHNLVEGSNSPVDTAAELADLGYAIALHPLLMLHGFIRQAPKLLQSLRATGSTSQLRSDIADLHEFNALLTRDVATEKAQ
jgi:2-methylisocitrate lyase-like PEP mutase family enzyme